MNKQGWAMLVLIVVLVGAIVIYWTKGHTEPPEEIQTTTHISAMFQCDGGKNIDAVFDNERQEVQLRLSDGRSVTVPRSRSADGARYANADESFVFWNVGSTATISEQDTETYRNCVTNS